MKSKRRFDSIVKTFDPDVLQALDLLNAERPTSGQLSTNFHKMQWTENDVRFAEFVETLWKKGKVPAKSLPDAIRLVAPHYKNRHGKDFDPKNLCENLRNKQKRRSGKK